MLPLPSLSYNVIFCHKDDKVSGMSVKLKIKYLQISSGDLKSHYIVKHLSAFKEGFVSQLLLAREIRKPGRMFGSAGYLLNNIM